MRTIPLRFGAALIGGALLAIALPMAASAHVEVTPGQADPESFENFTFTALNESDEASTIKVEIALPTDTPLLSVTYAPTPGWTTEVIRETLPTPVKMSGAEITEAATRIIFTADEGNGIRPGEFQQWLVALGPIPNTGQISFPATQSYDDGNVVEWSATPAEAKADSSLRPAPTLFVTDEPTGHAATESSEDDSAHSTTAPAEATSDPSTTVALILSIVALGIATFGTTIAIAAIRRRR